MKYFIGAERIDLFDEHWYPSKDGDVPSVTTYLEVAPKGKAFEMYLKTVKNPEEVRDEAAQLGSATHNLIERTLKDETVLFEDLIGLNRIEIWTKYIAWCLWFKQFVTKNKVEWEPEDVELILIDHDLGYGGTVDWVPRVNGMRRVIDWKTGRNIWDTAYIQLAAYVKAYRKHTNEPVHPDGLIVQLGSELNKNGYREYPVEHVEEDFEFFLMYQKIWHRQYPNRKPLYKTLPKSMNLDHLYNYKIVGGVNG